MDRSERWACANLKKFNEAKCKVVHLCQDESKHKYKLDGEWKGNFLQEERVRVFQQEMRMLQGDLLAAYRYLKGAHGKLDKDLS